MYKCTTANRCKLLPDLKGQLRAGQGCCRHSMQRVVCTTVTTVTDDLTAETLRWRALAHPLRSRLLTELREHPATSAELGRRLGQTRGNASYHLRVLAAAGLVVEEVDRGTARERWWRIGESAEVSFEGLVGSPQGGVAADAVASERARQLADFAHRALQGAVSAERGAAARVSDLVLTLDAQQQAGLVAELDAVVARWEGAAATAGPPEDGQLCVLQLAVFSRPADR